MDNDLLREISSADEDTDIGVIDRSLSEWFGQRVSYHLSFRRDGSRSFSGRGLSGSEIDNAFYNPENPYSSPTSDGSWDHPDMWSECTSEQNALRAAFRVAVTEALHEVCEWFKVDGETMLNPHGAKEMEIMRASERCADQLFEMAHS